MLEFQTRIDWSITIQMWANIATIINSVVVVISLLYLARQVKISTKATRGATYQTIINGVASIEARISQDDNTARIYKLGTEAPEQLNDIEMVRFNELISSFFNFYENLYFQAKEDLLAAELWAGWSKNLMDDLNKPGVRTWWEDRKGFYSESFRRYVDERKPVNIVAENPTLTFTPNNSSTPTAR